MSHCLNFSLIKIVNFFSTANDIVKMFFQFYLSQPLLVMPSCPSCYWHWERCWQNLSSRNWPLTIPLGPISSGVSCRSLLFHHSHFDLNKVFMRFSHSVATLEPTFLFVLLIYCCGPVWQPLKCLTGINKSCDIAYFAEEENCHLNV